MKPLNKLVKVSHSRFVEKRPADSEQQFVASSCEVGSFTINEDILEEVLVNSSRKGSIVVLFVNVKNYAACHVLDMNLTFCESQNLIRVASFLNRFEIFLHGS